MRARELLSRFFDKFDQFINILSIHKISYNYYTTVPVTLQIARHPHHPLRMHLAQTIKIQHSSSWCVCTL